MFSTLTPVTSPFSYTIHIRRALFNLAMVGPIVDFILLPDRDWIIVGWSQLTFTTSRDRLRLLLPSRSSIVQCYRNDGQAKPEHLSNQLRARHTIC